MTIPNPQVLCDTIDCKGAENLVGSDDRMPPNWATICVVPSLHIYHLCPKCTRKVTKDVIRNGR